MSEIDVKMLKADQNEKAVQKLMSELHDQILWQPIKFTLGYAYNIDDDLLLSVLLLKVL
jgi:hypothetical protein